VTKAVRKKLSQKSKERKDAKALIQFALGDAAEHGVVIRTADGKRITTETLKFYSE
jgi:hypothetical protein